MPRVNVKDKRKQQLMDANMASIAKRGLADTTIAHVSKGANLSRGIVNFYFTSKEKMMQETLAFLAEEFTDAWQAALAEARKKSDAPLPHVHAVLATLLGDRFCSMKRLAVWAAFLGHAGTHGPYAKIIRATDEAFAGELRPCLQKTGLDAKAAEQRARQLLALTRGHWMLSALGGDEKRPSHYADAWAALLTGAPVPVMDKEKVVKLKTPMLKPVKTDVPPGQLDFGDLFSR